VAHNAHSPDWNTKDVEWDPFRATASASAAAPVKQARGRRRKEGVTKCQVQGCLADLSILKAYHQRYKICELHLKAEHVVCDGAKRRFCQQCGRFHELSAFAPGTRSCRERLERHNARRRKPNVRKGAEASHEQGQDEDEEEPAAAALVPDTCGAQAGAQALAHGSVPATVGAGRIALQAAGCLAGAGDMSRDAATYFMQNTRAFRTPLWPATRSP
jgi:hypothetical protein